MDTKYFTYMLENEDTVPAMMMMMMYDPLPRSSQHQHCYYLPKLPEFEYHVDHYLLPILIL